MLAIELLEILEKYNNRDVFVFDIIEDQYNPVRNIRVDSEGDIIIEF